MSERLTDEELAEALSIAKSMHSLKLTAAVAELRERRAADLTKEEREVLGWIRGLAMFWNGPDADKGRAVLDKLLASGGAR